MAELPRKSHRILGDPFEYTPSQLENIKVGKSKSSKTLNPTETVTSTIIDFDVRGTEVNQPIKSSILGIEVTNIEFDQNENLTSHLATTYLQMAEIVQIKSDTAESSNRNLISEPDIDELESDIYDPEIHTPATTDIPYSPLSPRVKLIIIDSIETYYHQITCFKLGGRTSSFYQ